MNLYYTHINCLISSPSLAQYPADYVNQVEFTSMSMRDGPGRSYRFYKDKPVYAFGTGLSYTTFTFQWYETVCACVCLHACVHA